VGSVGSKTGEILAHLPSFSGLVSGFGLAISSNSAYSDQTTPAGVVHFKVGSYSVKNLSATESVNLTGLNIGFTSLTWVGEVTNISATVNSVPVGVLIPALPTTYSTTMTVSSTLLPSQTVIVDIYATIASGAVGAFRTNLIAYGTGTLGALYSTNGGGSFSGQAIYLTVAPTGNLIVTKNTAYPDQTIAPSTSHQKIASYTISNTTTESIKVTNISVGISLSGVPMTDLSNLGLANSLGVPFGTPLMPAALNSFALGSTLILAPGTTTIMNVYADVGTAAPGTINTTMVASGLGITTATAYSSGIAVSGQTITITGVCSITPTLNVAGSTVSQYVSVGMTVGVTDATRAEFKLVAPTATILTQMKISVVGANSATNAHVGMITAPFVGGVATLSGLSIAIPAGGAGINVDVYLSYPPVGTLGVPSGTLSTVSLRYLKFTCGGIANTLTTSVPAPTMKLVASKPILTFVDSSDTLVNSPVKIGSLIVAADTYGNIAINKIPLSIVSTGTVAIAPATNNIVVKDGMGSIVSSTNTTLGVTAGGTGSTVISIVSPGGWGIAAGTMETFNFYATPMYATSGSILTTTLGAAPSFAWTDLAGSGVTAAENGTYIYPYPALASVITAGTSSPCTVTSFNATPTTVSTGGMSTLSYNTTGCTSVSISGFGIMSGIPSGSYSTGPLTATTTYTLTATGISGPPAIATVTVTVTGITAPGWVQQTASGLNNWRHLVSSSNRTKLAVIGGITNIYTSTDSGVTWTMHPIAGAHGLQSLASSSDGMKLVTGDNSGYIYTSSDGGSTWIPRISPGLHQWWALASSADGQKIVAGDANNVFGYMYTSTDGGVTWIQQMASGGHTWESLASSADGTKLAAIDAHTSTTGGYIGGYIYTSTDSGAHWTQQGSTGGPHNWQTLASSADGMKLVAADGVTGAYTSIDGGVSFTFDAIVGSGISVATASSADGMHIAVANNDMATSADGGATWTHETISGGTHAWSSMVFSADGTKMAAADFLPGYIWTKN
jgi:hypothetical protein